MNILLVYFSTIIPLALLDAIWLIFISKDFYNKYLGFLFSKNINFTPIFFFYPIYALVMMFLVVLPAVQSRSMFEALWKGALLGLAAYSAYDLTNHATITNWPLTITLVDIGWGIFVTSASSVIAYLIITNYGN